MLPAARAEDWFRAYLDGAPLFLAVLRVAECALIAGCEPLAAPVLDLGCGEGFFAARLGGFDCGVDPDWGSLRRARRAASHRTLVNACGAALPFRPASFHTVVANSVLEHIPELDATLAEVARVLAPRGRLLITAPCHRFGELLAGSRLAAGLGLRRAAAAYGRWFNGHSRHFHTDDAARWTARLAGAGFQVRRWQYYLNAAAMRAFDLAHYLSVPRLLSRKLTGRWVTLPNPLSRAVFGAWLRRYADPAPVAAGGYIFLEAVRA